MSKPNNELSPIVKRTCESLARAQERRAKRLANLRSVYSYRNKHTKLLSDNLLLFDFATELAHKDYLEKQCFNLLSSSPKHIIEDLENFEIVRIGKFDKVKNDYMRISPKIIIDFSDLITKYKELNKDKNKDE